jgi:hypothetical protein
VLEVFLSIVLSPLLAPIELLVLLLGAMPIAQLRQIAGALQRLLSRSVRDSFVLLGSPTRRGAIVHRVEHDLRWLSRGCALVVVAHSQAAAIAHQVLRLVRPATLAALEALRHSSAGKLVWLALAGLVMVAAGVVLSVERLQRGSADPFRRCG